MKTLYIIRHAKSDHSAFSADHSRPLTHEGRKDAELVARAADQVLPRKFLICASTARRASETAMIFADCFAYPQGEIVFNDKLYTFDCRGLEAEVRALDEMYDCVLIFGHNEAATDFVNAFGSIKIDNLPTAGLVEIAFDSDWSAIKSGKTTRVILPRDLRS